MTFLQDKIDQEKNSGVKFKSSYYTGLFCFVFLIIKVSQTYSALTNILYVKFLGFPGQLDKVSIITTDFWGLLFILLSTIKKC